MDEGLCKVEPDPVFFYPIPNVKYPATAKFKITSTAQHKIAYKIRYDNKHPKMDVRISDDSQGTLSPGQCLGIEVSLMPGYNVMEHKVDSFKLRIWAIPEFLVKNYKLGPKWYKDAAAEDIDNHTLNCHIRQQADKEGNMPVISTKPTFHMENPEAEGPYVVGEWLMNKDGVIYRVPNKTKSQSCHGDTNSNSIKRRENTNNFPSSKPTIGSAATTKLPDLPTKATSSSRPSRIDQMRLVRHRAKIRDQLDQRADQIDHGMVICDQEHMRMAQEYREYMQKARIKCLDWGEKSREFFQLHPEYQEDEAFVNQMAQEIEDESVSGLSEAHRVRDSSPVSVPNDGDVSPQEVEEVSDETPILETLDLRIMDISAANGKSLRLLRDFIPN